MIWRRTGCGSEVCEVSGSKYGCIATANRREAYLLGHLRTYTNAITEVVGFCIHGWFHFSDRGKVVLNEHTERVWQQTGRQEGQEHTHRGWKGSVSLSARCDDEYESLCPQIMLMLLPNTSQTGLRSGYEEELEKESKFHK
jgi:hypothetical protein